MGTVLLVAVGGGLGAALRFVVDSLLRPRTPGEFPFATVLINVTGSLLLGVLTGLAVGHDADAAWRVGLAVGLCGGYTTFGTATVETLRLAEDGRVVQALANALGTVGLSLVAAAAGFALGS